MALGTVEGTALGCDDGTPLGMELGILEGATLGCDDGTPLGMALGTAWNDD